MRRWNGTNGTKGTNGTWIQMAQSDNRHKSRHISGHKWHKWHKQHRKCTCSFLCRYEKVLSAADQFQSVLLTRLFPVFGFFLTVSRILGCWSLELLWHVITSSLIGTHSDSDLRFLKCPPVWPSISPNLQPGPDMCRESQVVGFSSMCAAKNNEHWDSGLPLKAQIRI